MKKRIAFFTKKQLSENKCTAEVKTLIPSKKSRRLNIPKQTIDKVLRYLNDFEENERYLDSQLSINNLAKTIGTNPNYLSRIINCHKEKSFPQYINALRITSCITALQNEPIYQKFTISGIANKFGFNTPESFGKAFHLKTGVKPSFYIKNIETTYKSAS